MKGSKLVVFLNFMVLVHRIELKGTLLMASDLIIMPVVTTSTLVLDNFVISIKDAFFTVFSASSFEGEKEGFNSYSEFLL